MHSLPFIELWLCYKVIDSVAQEVFDAGAVKLNGQKSVDRCRHYGWEQAKLGKHQDRDQRTDADDGQITQLPEPHRSLLLEIVGVDIYCVHAPSFA